ncbi:hypothetical protein VTI74DRAFT_257 [Chaetomium olivicolor]
MALTLSEVVLPVFSKGLNTLAHILTVAEEHAKSNNLDPDTEYPNARLIDDMLPLSFQVQNATSTVRRTLARLEGKEDQPWEDNEKTIADLRARVAKAQELLASADRGLVDKRAEEVVELPLGKQSVQLTAKASALNQGVPNFFFHLQTAYTILRAKGVPIGKKDYIGSFLAQ